MTPVGVLAVDRPTEKWWWWEWLGREANQELIWTATREHVILTVMAVVIGLALSVPAAIAVHRHPRLKGVVLGTAGVLYTVPSLALYAILVPYTGLSRTTAASSIASRTLAPRSRSWLANSTMRMPFLAMMPTRSTRPIWL